METKRLLIRKFTANDWPDLYEYLSQDDAVKYEPYDVFSECASKAEALRRARDTSFWAVCLKDSGKVIGNIYLNKQEYDTWELGFVFNTNYQRRGYATEAAKELVDDVFMKHDAHRVVAFCNPLNERSWKLLERLGMHKEGHFIKNIYFKKDDCGNPLWIDTYQYAILSAEWNKK